MTLQSFRLGFDLVTVSRFARLYSDDSDSLVQMFAPSELEDVGQGVDRWERLAARFATKEAVFKALKSTPEDASALDVVVRIAPDGSPSIDLSGVTRAHAETLGIVSWEVTLGHTDDVAGAVVLACLG